MAEYNPLKEDAAKAEWDNMTVGLALGIPGLLLLCLAWPVYKAVTGSRRKKYAQQVMELSGEIIKEDTK